MALWGGGVRGEEARRAASGLRGSHGLTSGPNPGGSEGNGSRLAPIVVIRPVGRRSRPSFALQQVAVELGLELQIRKGHKKTRKGYEPKKLGQQCAEYGLRQCKVGLQEMSV